MTPALTVCMFLFCTHNWGDGGVLCCNGVHLLGIANADVGREGGFCVLMLCAMRAECRVLGCCAGH